MSGYEVNDETVISGGKTSLTVASKCMCLLLLWSEDEEDELRGTEKVRTLATDMLDSLARRATKLNIRR